MIRDAVEIQEAAAAFNPTERSSKVISGWVYGSESKKRSRDKNKRGSWEEKSYGREGKKEGNIGISLTTSEWGARGRSHLL